MSKRLTRKEFIKCLEAMYEEGPTVRYQNPDAWARFAPASTF